MHQLIDGLDLLGRGVVTELEALALFVACLCHDLDHRGTNNTFQVRKPVDWTEALLTDNSVILTILDRNNVGFVI